jgi:F-type H+-transporting ATPase subunit delta
VVSARELAAAERESLASGLALALGRKVLMKTEVSPSLLGGVRVEAAGKVFEGSMRGQLEAMRKELRAA